MVKINKDLGQAEQLKDKIEKALKTLEESERGKVNLTTRSVRLHPCNLSLTTAELGHDKYRLYCIMTRSTTAAT